MGPSKIQEVQLDCGRVKGKWVEFSFNVCYWKRVERQRRLYATFIIEYQMHEHILLFSESESVICHCHVS